MEARIRLSEALESIQETEELMALALVGLSERQVAFAIMLHDMPAGVRLHILNILPRCSYEKIMWYFYFIEESRILHDPKGYFSTTMTKRVLGTIKHKMGGIDANGSNTNCHVCKEPFMEEGEDVVWKECKAHIMHTECFQVEVLEGRNPLWGYCSCVA
ncbi:uncharacterized protein FPOAC1_013691 [Fusarium poae]|uniref:uncharacterized protein n=1 Tax=Fusarium poae TaxID=36050 RepID=UPI001D05BFAF|nr:uncharacterized protein FPOAC1_013691 [Fusarium poae]KAG8664353.1 hypothetical protein FPOAC1_013691 [Fusarium poae]